MLDPITSSQYHAQPSFGLHFYTGNSKINRNVNTLGPNPKGAETKDKVQQLRAGLEMDMQDHRQHLVLFIWCSWMSRVWTSALVLRETSKEVGVLNIEFTLHKNDPTRKKRCNDWLVSSKNLQLFEMVKEVPPCRAESRLLTFYMCKSAKWTTRTVSCLLHIVTLCWFVNLWMELLLCPGVTVLTHILLFTIWNLTPFISMFYIRAGCRPVRKN